MAPKPPGRQSVPDSHNPAATLAHQGPFPWVPFASLAAVIAVGRPVVARPAAPGVVALRGADEAVGRTAGKASSRGSRSPTASTGWPRRPQRRRICSCRQLSRGRPALRSPSKPGRLWLLNPPLGSARRGPMRLSSPPASAALKARSLSHQTAKPAPGGRAGAAVGPGSGAGRSGPRRGRCSGPADGRACHG